MKNLALLSEIETIIEDMLSGTNDVESVDQQKVIDMFRTHPDPTPAMVDSFAEDLGISKEQLEEKIYCLLSDMLNNKTKVPDEVSLTTEKREEVLKGGIADGHPRSEFDPGELRKGMKVEFEHTNNIDAAREIAEDHLMEDPDYYKKLEKMETGQDMPLNNLKELVSRVVQEVCKKHQTSIEEIFEPNKQTLGEEGKKLRKALAHFNKEAGVWGLIDDETREVVPGTPIWHSLKDAVRQAPQGGYIVSGQMEGDLPPWLTEKTVQGTDTKIDIGDKLANFERVSDLLRDENYQLYQLIKSGELTQKQAPVAIDALKDLSRYARREDQQQVLDILARDIEDASEGTDHGLVMEDEVEGQEKNNPTPVELFEKAKKLQKRLKIALLKIAKTLPSYSEARSELRNSVFALDRININGLQEEYEGEIEDEKNFPREPRSLSYPMKEELVEVAPPGREEQVKALKKKFPKGSDSPYKISWAQEKREENLYESMLKIATKRSNK